MEKTLEVLERCLNWREEHEIDSLLDAPADSASAAHAEYLRQSKVFRRLWHLDTWGRDDTNHLIMCHRIGQIEPKELLQDLTMEQIKMQFIRDMEYMVRRKEHTSIEAQASRYKHVSILDFSGFSSCAALPMGCLSVASR